MVNQKLVEKKNDFGSPESYRPQSEIERSLGGEKSHESPEVENKESAQEALSDVYFSADSARAKALAPALPVDNDYRKIEDILEADLGDYYFKMNAVDQAKFKVKGEETTNKILEQLAKPRVSARKILELIVGWLKFIVGINKFFLEQIAKIKTDKVLGLIQDRQRIVK